MGGVRLEMYKYKKFAVNAAKDLLYPDTVIEAIRKAKVKMKFHGFSQKQGRCHNAEIR